MSIYTNEELQQALDDALVIISKKIPLEAAATLATIADSRLVDISSLSSVLLFGYERRSFHPTEGVEYPTAKWPRKYRNFRVLSSGNIEMDLDVAPSASSEDVYIRYHKIHTSATLPAVHTSLVNRLAAAMAAINKPLTFVNELMDESTKFDNITGSLGDMDVRITQAIADSNEARLIIGDKREKATQAIDDMSANIDRATHLLASGEDLIGDNRDKALSLIEEIDLRATQILSSLSDDRDTIGEEYDQAKDAIDDVSNMVNKAITDVETARGFFNKANAGRPEIEYLNSAGSELQNALSKMNQAGSYQGLESTAQSHRNNAIAEMQTSALKLSQSRSYMGLEETPASYRVHAQNSLSIAGALMSQARAYLAEEETAGSHRAQSGNELNSAISMLRKSQGYIAHLRAWIATINTSEYYEAWGKRMLLQLEPELNKLSVYRPGYKRWPTG